jgi:hypothetical protein
MRQELIAANLVDGNLGFHSLIPSRNAMTDVLRVLPWACLAFGILGVGFSKNMSETQPVYFVLQESRTSP